jgi:hypothetical protein
MVFARYSTSAGRAVIKRRLLRAPCLKPPSQPSTNRIDPCNLTDHQAKGGPVVVGVVAPSGAEYPNAWLIHHTLMEAMSGREKRYGPAALWSRSLLKCSSAVGDRPHSPVCGLLAMRARCPNVTDGCSGASFHAADASTGRPTAANHFGLNFPKDRSEEWVSPRVPWRRQLRSNWG